MNEHMESWTNEAKTPGAGASRHHATRLRNCRRAGGRIRRVLRHFYSDTAGSVSVEFIVLTAAIVGIGVMAAGAISAGVKTSIVKTESCLTNTAETLTIRESPLALQQPPTTEQSCGRALMLKEGPSDAKTVKVVR